MACLWITPGSESLPAQEAFTTPRSWEYSAPLIAPENRTTDRSRAQKDPTVVFHDGRWHVFMTVKLPGRSAIEHCSFALWENAHSAARTVLGVSDSDYYCAPQVFWFEPHKKWYLVYQMGVPGAKMMWVAYSTTKTIADRLDGVWRPIADTFEKPFASARNIRPAKGVSRWTDNVSHGELIRDGVDQTLTIDPDNLRFIFQGMLEKDKRRKGYGDFNWRIGMLTPAE